MIRFIFGMIDRMIAVSGAVLFSQAPMFIHQYMQSLSGHVDELKIQIDSLKAVSITSGKTLSEYIGRFIENGDPDFAAQGKWMSSLLERYSNMSESLTALQDSSLWARPLLFIRHCYLDIAEQTYREFTPGLPFSMEGLAYGAAGLILFSSIFWLLKLGIKRTYDHFRKTSHNAKPDFRTPIQ
jgi:hypothetical protein